MKVRLWTTLAGASHSKMAKTTGKVNWWKFTFQGYANSHWEFDHLTNVSNDYLQNHEHFENPLGLVHKTLLNIFTTYI